MVPFKLINMYQVFYMLYYVSVQLHVFTKMTFYIYKYIMKWNITYFGFVVVWKLFIKIAKYIDSITRYVGIFIIKKEIPRFKTKNKNRKHF